MLGFQWIGTGLSPVTPGHPCACVLVFAMTRLFWPLHCSTVTDSLSRHDSATPSLHRIEAVDAADVAGEVGAVVWKEGSWPSLKEPLDFSEPHPVYLRPHPSHDRTGGAGTGCGGVKGCETLSARLRGRTTGNREDEQWTWAQKSGSGATQTGTAPCT